MLTLFVDKKVLAYKKLLTILVWFVRLQVLKELDICDYRRGVSMGNVLWVLLGVILVVLVLFG